MLKIILLGWIAGIAVMGQKVCLLWTRHGGSGCFWQSQYSVFWLICKTILSESAFYKFLILISASWALFCGGYHFADSALEHRLATQGA